MISDEQISPHYESQIEELCPAEEELLIITKQNNLPVKDYKELVD
jgi:hypothetical protein